MHQLSFTNKISDSDHLLNKENECLKSVDKKLTTIEIIDDLRVLAVCILTLYLCEGEMISMIV
jgi:hypothetical protein